MSQVVIVGAGPTGATLALLFVKRGIAVKLIEASRNFRRVFRGEGLMPSGLDALEQMGLLPMLERIPHRALDAWEFLLDNHLLFRVDEPFEIGGKPTTLVSQPDLLEALIAEASTYSNFEFIQSVSVQDLLWVEQRVAGVKLGDERCIDADLVIGADGRNSIVRQRANLPLKHYSKTFDVLWFKLPNSPDLKFENIFYSILHGDHAFGLFQGAEGHLQLGWSLHESSSTDWKQIDWLSMLVSVSPPWFAEHLQQNAQTIERPVLLSVVVGRCPRWSIPGLMLLGDAAHPMSPIRAQGINMALRDVIVTANHLIPVLLSKSGHRNIDAILPQIQTQREPEIVRVQQLQSQEAAQAQLLGKSALLRWVISKLNPLLHQRLRQSWLKRQIQLRQGIKPIQLTV
ncbi:FAD-dependent monooxygenase [Nostocaceae cyanobacterium CENA357]|uniref:FAD-dependent monooxygenase n=1 Tax=Atlanticothrix silvestris CENA357 TaxID=1725252 RepID=A0A8J7HIV2_9CYAN|nr:FAD-dependent monooxygenase [Atlanticothrix silvestris]MBH8556017.1 FAD-dependent monooxygenase [Atlanticothrix silvestris CENA357]